MESAMRWTSPSHLEKKKERRVVVDVCCLPEKLRFRYERRLFSTIDKFSTRPSDVSSSGKFFADALLIFALSSRFFVRSRKIQRDHCNRNEIGHGLSLHAGEGEEEYQSSERWRKNAKRLMSRQDWLGSARGAAEFFFLPRAKMRPVIFIIVERIALHGNERSPSGNSLFRNGLALCSTNNETNRSHTSVSRSVSFAARREDIGFLS